MNCGPCGSNDSDRRSWQTRSADVYTGEQTPVHLTEADTLSGGEVLPGFELRLTDPFAVLDD